MKKLLALIKSEWGNINNMAIQNKIAPQTIHSILNTISKGEKIRKPSIVKLAKLLPISEKELKELYG